jgi:hypothetical protein
MRNNPSPPLGIKLISFFYLFGAVVLIFTMFTNYGEVAEQITLRHGLPLGLKSIILPLVVILAIAIAQGLYSLSKWGYYLSLIYLIYFGAVSLYILSSTMKQPYIGNIIWSLIVVIYLIIKRRLFLVKTEGQEIKT